MYPEPFNQPMRNKISIQLFFWFLAVQISFGQQRDSVSAIKIDSATVLKIDTTKQPLRLGFAVLLTNNGISLIPSFSLGEPAVIFNFLVAKKRFSFEPEFRFSLKGKPWSFVTWLRYRLIESGKFRVGIGIHPAINFRTIVTQINGDSVEILQSRRFFAGEIAPSYFITKSISVGLYYLGSRGFDYSSPHWTNFFTINANFSNIKLANQVYMRFIPQVYYLTQDELYGYYWTASLGISHRKFPLTLLFIANQSIKTTIPTKDFLWSVNLIYSFNKLYVPL